LFFNFISAASARFRLFLTFNFRRKRDSVETPTPSNNPTANAPKTIVYKGAAVENGRGEKSIIVTVLLETEKMAATPMIIASKSLIKIRIKQSAV